MGCFPRVRIDLDALRHNLQRVRATAAGRRIMAVIKADGYGHGMERIAGALNEADALAVARTEEGLLLREAGFAQPIVVLSGCVDKFELEEAGLHRLQPVVHHETQLNLLERHSHATPVNCWLKVDTGMHRLGFSPAAATLAYQRLLQAPSVVGRPGIMTHLANADDRKDSLTEEQLALFLSVTTQLDAPTSLANSAGILGWPATHGDWVRPGIMLYGASPFIDGLAADHDLRPVMTFKSRLIAVNHYQPGDAIGYGSTWRCPEAMPVGVVAAGYGDGYPRYAPSGTPVLINGQRAPLVGRVSMDMISVDLRSHPQANIGDEVVLWGQNLPVEEIATAAGTIPYQLFCNITHRVVRESIENGVSLNVVQG